MLQNRYLWAGVIITVLLVANLIRFFISGWGLITVRVHDVPLAKVIKSIEHQGWVTIYTNIDPNTPISMDVYQVPLAEAMESLTANVPAPAPPEGAAAPGPGAAPGRRGGGFGGGGFGGGAQWKLAFFAAPSSAQVREEIRSFQAGGTDDDAKIYSYPTPLQMLAVSPDMPVADPREQIWPGLKPPAPTPPAATDSAADNAPAADPAAAPTNVQDYLDLLAQSADIWIMSPSGWQQGISAAPSAGGSIADAVKRLVGRAHGSVEQAFVVYQRGGGPRGGGNRGRGRFVGGDWSNMEDRLRNAINGLPADSRGDALNQLNQEVDFQKQVRVAPPDQRRNMMRDHMRNRMGGMDNWRRSPETRAKMYSRVVSNRQSVRGQ